MNKSSLLVLLVTLLSLSLSGCLSNSKTVILQGGSFKKGEATLVQNAPPVYKLQVNDVLSIRIKSLDPDQVEYLSLESMGVVNVNPAAAFMSGYSVNDSGFIHMPAVGKVKVVGLTISEARYKIEERIRQTEVGDATVFVNLVSFKVSVAGEVNAPSQFYVYNNQLNLIEAVSLAGGFTDFADRSNVKLIRQTPRGSEVVLLDMRKAEILSSPYYYLLPNDMLVVDPLEEKFKRSNLSTLVIVNTVVGTISATVGIISVIQSNRAPQPE